MEVGQNEELTQSLEERDQIHGGDEVAADPRDCRQQAVVALGSGKLEKGGGRAGVYEGGSRS